MSTVYILNNYKAIISIFSIAKG